MIFSGNATGVFAKADIPPMMNAVFDAGSMIADRGMELYLRVLGVVGTGHVVADFITRFKILGSSANLYFSMPMV